MELRCHFQPIPHTIKTIIMITLYVNRAFAMHPFGMPMAAILVHATVGMVKKFVIFVVKYDSKL